LGGGGVIEVNEGVCADAHSQDGKFAAQGFDIQGS